MQSDIKEIKLAYAAGLIDGEGCIGIYYNSHNGNYQLRITVEMCERQGLEILYELFDGKWYYKEHSNRPNRRPVYVWMLFNSRAEDALGQLVPYLQVKHKHAINALSVDWHSFAKRPLPPEENEKRAVVHKLMKEYNIRGTKTQ